MWSQQCTQSFNQTKQALVSSAILVHYDPQLPIRVAVDASAYGIGAVLLHILEDRSEHPIAYASRTLSQSEKNYAQVEKEALVLVYSAKKFHQYLYGRRFTLITDHKLLVKFIGGKNWYTTHCCSQNAEVGLYSICLPI